MSVDWMIEHYKDPIRDTNYADIICQLQASYNDYTIINKVDAIPGLYLGNWKAAMDLETLNAHNIKGVVQVTASFVPPFKGIVGYYHIPIPDNPNIVRMTKYFDDAFNFIDNWLDCEYNVLIHCDAGVSRTGAFAIGYIMHDLNVTLKRAHIIAMMSRRCINAEHWFPQLECYEHDCVIEDVSTLFKV